MRRAVLVLLVVAAACGDSGSGAEPQIGPGTTSSTTPVPIPTVAATDHLGLQLEPVVTGEGPILAMAAPRGDARLFLAEKLGLILVHENGSVRDEPFLDISDLVGAGGLEQGLLGLAFHPAYRDNGRFFVSYTDTAGDTAVAEYSVGGDPNVADPDSGRILLEVDQPAGNHNGGMIAFGPDGYLYLGLGDGGGANDQFGHGQRPDSLLGALLRLDVDAGEPYAIPPDNPFASGEGGAPEVWAYGLRNPWRFAFDGDLLYIADVGQARVEEVHVSLRDAAGLNYGWSVLEGDECFEAATCAADGLEVPQVVYDHTAGCSVTGGYVYRGGAIPEIQGHYFYGDWCGGWIRSFRFEGGAVAEQRDWTDVLGVPGQILTFGVDGVGELYVSTQDEVVFRLVPVP